MMTYRILSSLLLLLAAAMPPGCRRATAPEVRTVRSLPSDAERQHDHDFAPTGGLEQLSEHLYRYEDAANVYIIKSGGRATLIDFGTGDILGRMGEIGVAGVDRVLVTHHHRDQVQGLTASEARGIDVVVPAREVRFFEDVESFWKSVPIYFNYDLRSYWNTLRTSIEVSRQVAGGDEIESAGTVFRVIETPGATDGSVSYSALIDSRRVVFTGDLIAGEGKLHNWFDFHWAYYGFTNGIEASAESFERIGAEQPDVLLPSHGDPIEQPVAAMEANSLVYDTLREMLPPNELHRESGKMRAVLPHLVFLGGLEGRHPGELTTYAILSDSGKALLYDYGYVDPDQVEKLMREHNVRSIDAVTFSHYHDDHIVRSYELVKNEGAEVWVFENMADIFAHPRRYRLPCLIPFPIEADRILKDGERVRWEEYELEFFHMPGQTEFHQGLVTTIDGKRVMFTGDNTWKKRYPEKVRNGPLVPQNEYFLDGGFITCARKMIGYAPEIVCPAHTAEYSPTLEDLEGFLGWAERLRDVMTGLIAQPDPNYGVDSRWCHFYPFRQTVAVGEEFEVEVRVRNHLYRPARVTVWLKYSDAIECSHPLRVATIAPKTEIAIPFRVRKTTEEGGREIMTADVTIDGHRFGEVAEMIVD